MGDGLVERMNRSLLNLLRIFVQNEGDWEHLQLLLYIYRTTKHSSTGLSPYEILFGQNPPSLHIPNFRATAILDPSEYHHQLQKKLLKAVVGGPAGPAMAGPVLGHNKKFQMCSNLLQVSN